MAIRFREAGFIAADRRRLVGRRGSCRRVRGSSDRARKRWRRSIQTPASCCSVSDLKPTRGREPAGAFKGDGWGGLASDGVISRTVRDTARALDLIGGFEPGAPYASPSGSVFEACPGTPFARPLRIAFWRDPWGLSVEPICLKCTADDGHVV
ncbi:hypothetical protein FXB40_24850 [Bradyrhizobium rifense]|uniref:Amidase domain-containing protein n=1 Tax=Bradyrhizobium rifense TaxID=515499 RepID=A0A5D3K9Y7_9BRAD|nr:hypothetical protein FXB40_24850 [Bradyrhizobium rifense]